jgi:fructose-specific component phosphotransferase system IIB-like protein
VSEYPVSRRRRIAGAVTAWTLGGVLALGALAAVWIGVRGFLAYGHLEAARQSAAAAGEALTDPATAADLVSAIGEDTAAAHALTGDPVWSLAEGLPWIGPQLHAVSTIAATADDVASSALAPLAEVASTFSLDSLRPEDGRFDVAALASLREPAATSAGRLADAASQLHAIDTDALLGLLRAPVSEVQGLITEVAEAADGLQRVTALMPAMMGADGPREYLILFENSAEWRSLGGIAGAMATIRTEDGRLSLTTQSSTSEFSAFEGSVAELSPEVLDIFTDRPGRYIQNTTQVPDFTVGAPIAREMWARQFGTQVDGVIAVDPVSLSYLLEATGPVSLPTGDELSAETAVSLLLNDVYLRYEDPREQDAFFAAATAAVFERLSAGDADPATLVDALTRAGSERRLVLWSADPAEQAVLDGTTLQGTLPVTDADTTRFGVFFNDGTGSKMDYYMTAGTSVGWCRDTEGAAEAELSVLLRSDAPADAASLPRYITGGGNFGVAAGTVETVTYLYLPPGAEVIDSGVEGGDATGFGGGMHDGHRVLTWTTRLLPGAEATASVRVRVPATAGVEAIVTPTAQPLVPAALAPACAPAG